MVASLWIILAGVQFMHISVCSAYTAADATALQAALLTGYSSKVRPSALTTVDVSFGLMHITELNNVNQRIHVVGFALASPALAIPILTSKALSWVDSRLTWVATDYGNMQSTYMLLSDIWSPPLLLNNAADEIQMMNDDSDLASVNVHLSDDGTVGWLAPANFIAQCTIDITYYPLDSQQCYFVISSWIFVAADLQLGSTSSFINKDLYAQNGEWDLTRSSVRNLTRTLLGHPMPAVEFTTYLTRKYSYYLMNMILPVVVLAVMEPFVFLLPVDSGEKIGYTLTILLSLSVIMTVVSDSIPPTSTPVCILSVYLLITFIVCSVETLLTVMICRIHDLHLKNHRLGPKQQTLARILAKITMSSDVSEEQNKEVPSKLQKQKSTVSNVSKIKIKGNEHLSTEVKKIKAWSQDDDDGKLEKGLKEYSFEDMALFLDKFSFVLFLLVTVLITLGFIIVVKTGGS